MPQARCERCRRFKVDDGVLLCPRCRSLGTFQQSVTIYVPTAQARIADGVVEHVESGPGKLEVRAVVKAGKDKLVAKRIEGQEYRARGRRERKTIVSDQMTEYYRQTWYHDESGEEHGKTGRLDDADMHGPKSAAQVKKVVRPPET